MKDLMNYTINELIDMGYEITLHTWDSGNNTGEIELHIDKDVLLTTQKPEPYIVELNADQMGISEDEVNEYMKRLKEVSDRQLKLFNGEYK